MPHEPWLGRRTFLGMSASCAFCRGQSAVAQSLNIDDPSIYIGSTRTVLANARNRIEPTLLPAEAAIARSIIYRVIGSGNANAFAVWEDGNRAVLINAGMIQVFDWLANALIIDKDLGYTGCVDAYGAYLGQGIIDNSMRVQQGLPLAPVLVPGAYAAQVPGPCHGATLSQFTARPELAAARSRMMEASIMFVYLHETGHHVLNHVPMSMVDNVSKQMHRSQEDAADRWAIMAALRAGYPLQGAYPWTMFVALLGGNSIEAEVQSTHPLGVRRDLVLYEQSLAYLKAHPESWGNDTTGYQAAVQTLANAVDKTRQYVDSLH